ncbi:MAG TPA: dTMP kinase [Thermoclostridium caenicola]|uniref:dTMP kinase n=1 Tax=Thermoclostridium caenicola TaxID=659425 RepID=UPI002BC9DE77|nr:dTMP kinase [Thermoclostridium caenicola]HOK43890.1 dTMP kinase [Thermoclostridium caenicola]HOL85088.1 dTMP kinase [Thermoclostridium caenicola]HOP73141.1 dTMP kinase [Thermoclostridium caenicola]HPO75741.1 dTMP kinase [Thermoclostridium caenicola]HPU22131.1 dTMP kinase [Thermoclostridium caenicola]
MNEGIFITFEGNDGSGKTTQIRLLADYLKQRGLEVLILREPGGTSIGEKIRDILLDNSNQGMCAVAEMLLYAASRAQLVSTIIKPALAENKAVICDRFVDSSMAYQGIGRGLGTEKVWMVNQLAIDGCLPDITFFMDVDADTAMARRNAKGEEADRIESEDMVFHRRVYSGYLELAKSFPDRIRRIDVNRNPDAVFAEIRGYVDELLKKAGR